MGEGANVEIGGGEEGNMVRRRSTFQLWRSGGGERGWKRREETGLQSGLANATDVLFLVFFREALGLTGEKGRRRWCTRSRSGGRVERRVHRGRAMRRVASEREGGRGTARGECDL